MKDEIVFSGKIGELIHSVQTDGRIFERFRRPPGVRLIIVSPDKKILVSREHRSETGGLDLRLPGGKVCDSIEDYHALLKSGRHMTEVAKEAAVKEALEETGLIIKKPQLVVKANAGATVEWDLYYFLVNGYAKSPAGQHLEYGEDIETVWLTANELRQAIANNQMQEWRTVGVLLAKILPTV